jgi:uncharacterized membrane protein YfcA
MAPGAVPGNLLGVRQSLGKNQQKIKSLFIFFGAVSCALIRL